MFAGVLGMPNDEVESLPTSMEQSPAIFDVLSPAGGEVWKGGDVIDIEWSDNDICARAVFVDVYYSIDGGCSWVLIGESVRNEGRFAWRLPHLNSDECLVKVETGGWEGALSDSVFTIDSAEPMVNVMAPCESVVWISGSIQEITWSTEDNYLMAQNTVDIYYSINGGLDWDLLADNEPNDGSYDWRIPFTNSGTCLVKVTALDLAGNRGQDSNDGYFTISDELANAIGTQSPLNGGDDRQPFSDQSTGVLGPVDHIVVAPDPATVEVGTQQSFTAIAYDANNSVIPNATFFWSTDLGVIIHTGVLTAQTTPGTGFVSATYASVTGYANVTVVPGSVHHIDVAPSSVFLEVGASQAFSATAYDVYNNLLAGIDFDWNTNVGSVDPSGSFTAQTTPGFGSVTAANGTVTGLASVEVLVGPVTSIQVSPAFPTVVVGENRQFTATAYDQFGNLVSGVGITWTATNGTVTAGGLFTAPTTPGLSTITATYGPISGNSVATIEAGPLHHILVTPDPVTLQVGDSQLFTATAYDEYDNIITGVSYSWTTDVGTVDGTGLFTAQTTPGSGTVEATSSSITGSAGVTVTLGNADHIVVSPNPITLSVGGTRQFTATAYDAHNNAIPGVTFDWTTDVGSIDAGGFLTAQTTPTVGVVEATNGTLVGTAVVTVKVGAVDYIILLPGSATMKVGETLQFTAAAYDAYNNLIPDAAFFWTTTVGVVNSTGFFTAQTVPGNGYVNVTSGAVTESASITVLIGDIHHIVVSPSPFTIMVGLTQAFSATAYDAYDNVIVGAAFAWSTDVGTVDAGGLFTAQTVPGTGVVAATNDSVTGEADVTVIIGDIDSIIVSPDPATVKVGKQRQFTAIAYDQYGNVIPGVSYNWTTDIGTVNPTGLFTAQTTVSSGVVEAENNSILGTASVTLIPGDLNRIDLAPNPVSVKVDDTQQFTATGFDVYGNEIVGLGYNWSTNVGSVDNAGLFTAQTLPDTGWVRAKNGSATGWADVTVITGDVDHIVVLPSPILIMVGDTQQFTATAYDSFDNIISGVMFFWTTDLGVVNSTGFFTANTIAKLGFVNATTASVTGSAIVEIVASSLDHIVVTPSPVSVVVGTQQQFNATAYDVYDNVITNTTFFWSTNLGVVNYAGLFTARSRTGTGYVRATSGAIAGSAIVTIIPADLHHIVVTPNPAIVIVGEDQQFNAIAYDVYNNVITGMGFDWSTNVGSVDQNGLFTAQTLPASGTIIARNGTVSGSAVVHVVSGTIDYILVSPNPATVVVGTTRTFTATAYDGYDNAIPGVDFTWSTSVGIIDSSGLLTAQTSPGFGIVLAINGSVTGSANVEIVVGPLDHIFVTPTPVTVVVGQFQAFSAVGYDIYNNVISGVTFAWGTTIGSIDASGLFTAPTAPGVAVITAMNGTVTGTALATVIPGPVDHIIVTPDPATVPVGAQQQFTAVAYDSYANAITGVAFIWTTDVGSVGPTGLFTAQFVPGSGFISARNGTVTGTAVVNVVVGPVASIVVVPDPVTVVVGANRMFSATAYDAYGNLISGVTFAWTTTVGSIDATGFLTAQTTPGAGTVTATNGSVSGFSIVTIITGPLDHIGVAPDPADVGAGESQQFAATGYDIYDNPISGLTFTWTTNVGVVNSTGYLTAQTSPTSGMVTATVGLITGQATVNVVPGAVALIFVFPDPLTIVVGDTQQFNTLAFDAYNNFIPNVDYIWTTNVGTIDSDGFFTAQTTPGTGTVTATNGTVSGFSSVTVITGPLDHIVVTPNPWTMTADNGKQFFAAGYDLYDNPVAITPAWSVNGGGSVDVTGYFTADIVGTWVIFANDSGISGNATVNVLHGIAVSIDVTPDFATITADDTLIFTAMAYDFDGNTWDVTAGTAFTENDPLGIMIQNAYIAGRVGNWTVMGNYGGLTDSAFVNVIPGAAAYFILDSPGTIPAGIPFGVTLTVYDANDNVKTDYLGTVALSSTDPYPAALPPDHTFTSADSGTYSFFGLMLFTRPSQNVTATDISNSTLTDSDLINVLSSSIQPEKSAPETAEPADIITYTIYYNNTGEMISSNVWLNDTLPAEVNFVSATGGGTYAGGVVYWHFTGVLPGIWSVSVTVSVDLGLENGLLLTNWVFCDYTTSNGYMLPQTMDNATTRIHYLPIINVDKTVELVIKDIIVEPDQWGTCTLGVTIPYMVNITNLQAVADSIDLDNSSLLGWTVQFFNTDWTPLSDTNGDPMGLPDTGVLAANGGQKTIFVNHTVPTWAGVGDEDVVFVTGTSFSDPNVIDIARLNTTAVASPPKEVVLVLDTSGSMSGQPIIDLRNAAIQFVNTLEDTDYVALIRFSSSAPWIPWLLQDLTLLTPTGRSQTIARINSLTAYGGTPIWDSIWDGINLVDGTENIPVVVAMTDGEDYNSQNGYKNDDTQEWPDGDPLGRMGQDDGNTDDDYGDPYDPSGDGDGGICMAPMHVFTIGLSVTQLSEWQLQEIGRTSAGGEYYFAPTSAQLQEIYEAIAQEVAQLGGTSSYGSKEAISAGDKLMYKIFYNNTGIGNAGDVWVNDTLPGTLMLVDHNASVPYQYVNGYYSWHFQDVPPGSHWFWIVVEIGPSVVDNEEVLNVVNLVYTDDEGNELGVSSDFAAVTVSEPAIELEKTASATTAEPGDLITYTIHYNNTGSAMALYTWINDTFDPNLAYVSDTAPVVPAVNGNTYSWEIPGINTGNNFFTVTVRVLDGTPGGFIIPNQALAEFTNEDNIKLDYVSASNIVNITIQNTLINVGKTVDHGITDGLKLLTYTLYFNNTGSDNANYVWVNDTLPAEVSYVSDTSTTSPTAAPHYWSKSIFGRNCRFIFRNVNPGLHMFQITVQVHSGTPDGTYLLNNVTLDYTDDFGIGMPASTDDALSICGVINVTKSSDLTIIPIGASTKVRLTIEVKNTHYDLRLTNIYLEDGLPPGITWEGNAIASSGTWNWDGSILNWTIPELDPLATATLSFDVSLLAPVAGSYQLNTGASATGVTETNYVENATSNTVLVSAQAAPVLDFSISPAQPISNSIDTYTLTVTNIGTNGIFHDLGGDEITFEVPAHWGDPTSVVPPANWAYQWLPVPRHIRFIYTGGSDYSWNAGISVNFDFDLQAPATLGQEMFMTAGSIHDGGGIQYFMTRALFVELVIGPLHHITVQPHPLVCFVAETHTFTATAYDQWNNVIPGVVFIWSTNVGTINETGVFIAPTTPVIGRVRATNGSIFGQANVAVYPGAADRIDVTPNPATVIVGDSQQFTATAYDVYNNQISFIDFAWTTTVGSVDDTGLFTAQLTPATGLVTATNGSVSGSATVIVSPGSVDRIVVTPDPITLIVGDSQQFTVTAYDVYNNIIPGAEFVWTSDVGTVNSTGLFTAQTTPGIGTITAANGTASGNASIEVVVGPFDHITVSPDPANVVVSTAQLFTAVAYDAYDNALPGYTFVWDTNVGSIDASGLFIAQTTTGIGYVSATNGPITGYAIVNVISGSVDHIVVTPDPATVIVGMIRPFTARAYDVYNNEIPGVGFIWSTNVGTIDSFGVFLAQTVPGSGVVIARNGTVSGQATVEVIVGSVDHITVTPSPVSIKVGRSQVFTATAYDIYDNPIPGTVFAWTTDVGMVSQFGLFTAQTTPQAGYVNATNGTVTGSADVNVVVENVATIIVTPDPATVPVGGYWQFTAVAYDTYNNPIPNPLFIWTSNVGVVNSTGYFTAQTIPATGVVSARIAAVTGSASVDVVLGPLHHILVTPDPVDVTVGETQAFTAVAYDAYNNVLPGIGFTWSTDVGTVDASGFFTAWTIPGIGVVQATNGTVSGTADVEVVVGAIEYVLLTPNPADVTVGSTRQFTATAYDIYDNPIPGVEYDWTTDAGTVDDTGLFTAQTTPGSGTITAMNGTIGDTAVVNVLIGGIDHIIVTPDPASVEVGTSLDFDATAYDKYDNVITGVVFAWTTDLGSVDPSGYFTAQTAPGLGYVRAENGTFIGNAGVEVTPGPVDHIVVTPNPATVVVGKTQAFTATAHDSYNNVITGAVFIWSTNVGTVNSMGVFTAQTTPGVGTVIAMNGTVFGTSSVSVVIGTVVDHIVVLPNPAYVTAGDTHLFTATAYDEYDNVIVGVGFFWMTNVGIIDTSGMLTAQTTPKVGFVSARNGTVTGSATVNIVPGAITTIVLTPDPAQVTVGEDQQFIATGYDMYNNAVPGADFVWFTDVGSIDSTGLFTAQTAPATGIVRATNGTVSDTASVEVVIGPVYTIIVTPDNATVTVGNGLQFTATAYDVYNNPIPGAIFLWTTNAGVVNSAGYFTAATSPVIGWVRARSGAVTGSASVTVVVGSLDHIEVTPDPMDVTVGGSQQFTATAYDIYNNPIPGVVFGWTTNVGTADSSGYFTARTTPGSGIITAMNGTYSDSAVVNVIVGEVDRIVLVPNTVSVAVGTAQLFTAVAMDIYNNVISGVVFDWTTDVGSVDAMGLFTAQTTPAAGQVTATNGTVSGWAFVDVIPGPVDRITIVPDDLTINAGDTQTFIATAYDSYDNVVAGADLDWTTDVGTVDEGFFTAQVIPATGTVVVANGTVNAVANVDVVIGPLDHIFVSPDPATVTVGTLQLFTAVAYDRVGNAIPGVAFLWSTDVGAIDALGFFTAQTTTGVGIVSAANGTIVGSAAVDVVPGPVNHIIVTPDPVNIIINGVEQFTAVAYDSYANEIPGVAFDWTTDVGSVDATGLFTAQPLPGIGSVTATNGTVSDSASVDVIDVVIDHIIVTPDPVTIAAGGSQQFIATAYDQFNAVIMGVEFTWWTDVGSVDAFGLLTAQTTPITGSVTATNGTITGIAVVDVVPGPVDHIIVNPDPASVVVGTSQVFTATAYDVYNNVIPGVTFSWNTDVGTIDAGGMFTAQITPGVGTLRATNYSVVGVANVNVIVGPIDHIIIDPDLVTIGVGDTRQFTASAYDAYDNPIPGAVIVWATNVGSIDGAGLLTAQTTPKMGFVSATNGTVTELAIVNVIPGPIDHISVIPNPVSVVAGGTRTFTALGFDSYNNLISGVVFQWTTDVGTINTGGTLTAQTTTAVGTVTATNGTVSGLAVVNVIPGPVDHITVTPDPVTVVVGDQQAFTAVAYDSYNNVIPNVDFLWTTDVGTVDSIGRLTAQTTPGSGLVTAEYGTVSDSASVEVVAGPVANIIIIPNPVVLEVNEIRQFFAFAYDQYNNPIPGADFIWASDVGTIDTLGVLTAQTVPGSGSVTASNGTAIGLANVDVVVGPVDHVIVLPDPVSIAVGGSQLFTATAYDVYDNVIPGIVFDWTTNVGSIDASGLLTAQTSPISGTVVATNGTVSGVAIVDVVTGPIHHILIFPNVLSITVGGTQSFFAFAYDMYNNWLSGVIFDWTTNVGSIDAAGLYTAQTTPGTGFVTVSNNTVSMSAGVTVNVGPLDHIAVTPNPANIIINGVYQFTAKAFDSYNNLISGAGFDWTTDVGVIDATGLFTAQAVPGVGTVTATNGTVSGVSDVTVVLLPIMHIKVEPNPKSVMVGTSFGFAATAYDQFWNVIFGVGFDWSTNVGTIDQSGLFTAQTRTAVGSVTATNGTASGSAVVNVTHGPLDHIVVVPDPAKVRVGMTQLFRAIAFDMYDNVISKTKFEWSTDVGSIDTAGLFTAQTTPATGTVTAANGTVEYSATVIVVPGPLDHIIVSPDPATVTAGETQQFTAVAYDAYNNVIPGVSFDWTTDVGTINANGLFTAQLLPGTGTVTASNGIVEDSAVVNVLMGSLTFFDMKPGPIEPVWDAMKALPPGQGSSDQGCERALLDNIEAARGW